MPRRVQDQPQSAREEKLTPLPVAEEDGPVQRRSFLGLCTVGLGACAGLGVLGAVGTAVVGTPLQAKGGQGRWIDVGPLARFEEGKALKVPAVAERRDAWNRFAPRTLGGVVVIRSGAAVRVFSARCPHNGCGVFVSEAELVCPCHDSRFSLEGAQTRGESPRDLDPLDAKVVDGRVLVLYQQFVVGTEDRRPV
jgi:nitrite reductase/ring-hydroxylating ferredoxin subunit